jgi:GNAT superfamily N-acetyltransferase
VGTIDGVVVGYLELGIEGPLASVRQVYVDPEARELGLGDELLATALECARAAGCRTLEGVALPGDRETKNLYERAGIKARKIVVSIPL